MCSRNAVGSFVVCGDSMAEKKWITRMGSQHECGKDIEDERFGGGRGLSGSRVAEVGGKESAESRGDRKWDRTQEE